MKATAKLPLSKHDKAALGIKTPCAGGTCDHIAGACDAHKRFDPARMANERAIHEDIQYTIKGPSKKLLAALKNMKPEPLQFVQEDRDAERRWLLAQGAVVGLIVARNAIGALKGSETIFTAHSVVEKLLVKQEKMAAKLMDRMRA